MSNDPSVRVARSDTIIVGEAIVIPKDGAQGIDDKGSIQRWVDGHWIPELWYVAAFGNVEKVEKMYSKISKKWSVILTRAAAADRVDMMEMIWKLDSLTPTITNWDLHTAICAAAAKDKVKAMRYLKTLSSRVPEKEVIDTFDLIWAFDQAASCGAINALKLLHEDWKIGDADRGLCRSAAFGQKNVMKLCIQWGATAFGDAVKAAYHAVGVTSSELMNNIKLVIDLAVKHKQNLKKTVDRLAEKCENVELQTFLREASWL